MTTNDRRGQPDLGRLLEIAAAAALEAGKAVLDVYASDFSVETKADASPLTLADKRSHEIISRRLSEGRAGAYPLLSEEGRDIPYAERKAWDRFWLVDPLDGTKEFVKRNGEFTVNIALVHGHFPVLGVIYVPVTDVLYIAAEGLGAYRIDKAAGAAAEPPLLDRGTRLPAAIRPDRAFTVIASRSHLSAETEAYLQALRGSHEDMEVVSAGSSLKFCLIAEDAADIYPRFAPTMEWDTAAGQAIVEAAGGIVAEPDRDGQRMEYNKQDLRNGWFIAMRKRATAEGHAFGNATGRAGQWV